MTIPRTDPAFLAVARGDALADLILTNARIINVFTRTIENGSISIFGGRIAAVGDPREANETIDLHGSYLAPGFIDAHMHVESTMLLPSRFVQVAAPHGTTGVVFDPHEIANVCGIEGIRYLMDDARGLDLHAMFSASSCVPASPLETSGAEITTDDIRSLFEDGRVVALAEMMNFPGVVNAVPEVLEKVRLGLDERIVDGHAPGLTGSALMAYAAAGISSDHECTTAAEAEEKLKLGMRIFLREGSAARNLEALLPLVNESNAHRFCFCTDDRHPGALIEEGHIDHVVRKAIHLGLDPILAITLATINPAEHYRQPGLGAVAPGRYADLIVFDDLQEIHPRLVYCRGVKVAENGTFTGTVSTPKTDRFRNSVHLPAHLEESSFHIPASPSGGGDIRVIGMDPHQLITEPLTMSPQIEDNQLVADPDRDLLKLAVIERHDKTGNIGLGFVHGFGLKQGAIASTVGHDSHNLTIAGTNDRDMLLAARALADSGGGQCVVANGEIRALLPLPIAGLLSNQLPEIVAQQQKELHQASKSLGCPHPDPFMPLSFLPLTVIPHLKLSDRGLVDVDQFKIIKLSAQ